MPGELRAIPQLSPELWQLWCDTNGPTADFCWDVKIHESTGLLTNGGCRRAAVHSFGGSWRVCDDCAATLRAVVCDLDQVCSACRLRELVEWGETATAGAIEVAVSLFDDPAPMRELLDLAEASVALV